MKTLEEYEALLEKAQTIIDIAGLVASQWRHEGRCRVCDETMETLKAALQTWGTERWEPTGVP